MSAIPQTLDILCHIWFCDQSALSSLKYQFQVVQ